MEEKCINFLSSGGNPFHLPFDMDLISIKPMMEGILIGWGKTDFNYCVLLHHPLAQIMPLGIYQKNLESIGTNISHNSRPLG
jgi:hypothetical protein